MKKLFALLLATTLLLSLCACAGTVSTTAEAGSTKAPSSEQPTGSDQPSGNPDTQPVPDGTASEPEPATGEPASSSNILVVYFSRTGEQYTVGTIDKGNTAIVAEMIAEKTGADLFEILPETDYPYTYANLTDVAKKEQNDNARPAIKDALPDLSQYDTVFIGAPVWWGDWPMILYTFFETADLSGKNLVPFSTHEGSGLSGFDRKLAAAVPDATVLTGQAFRGNDCQNDKAGVESKVQSWLEDLGY